MESRLSAMWGRLARPAGVTGPRPRYPRALGHCRQPLVQGQYNRVWHRALIVLFPGGIMSLMLFSLYSSSLLPARCVCVPMALLGLLFPGHGRRRISEGQTILLGVGDHPAIIPMLACRPTKSIMVKAGRGIDPGAGQGVYGSDRSKTLYFDKGSERGSGVGVAITRQPALHQADRGVRQFGREQGRGQGIRAQMSKGGEIPAHVLFISSGGTV